MSADRRARRVVVFGGTGRTGRLIVADALADGHAVTVAARRPETLTGDAALPSSVTLVQADVRDPEVVERALAGQDVAIVAVSSPARKPGGVYSDAARAVVAGAAVTGLERVIAISSGGVRRDDPALPFWYRRLLIPFVMSDLYDDMALMERTLIDSPLSWTVVRASYLVNGTSHGAYRVASATTPAHGWKLTRGDLARFTVDQVGDTRWVRGIPTLAE